MVSRGTPILVAALCLVGFLLIGCGEDEVAGPPPTGSIEVSLSMTGGLPDGDGCLISVDDGPGSVLSGGESLSISGLAVGTHTVTISDLAPNCSVQGEASRAVSVESNETVAVPFAIECPAPASILVSTITAGSASDPDGYTILLDGTARQTIGATDTATLAGLTVGAHNVTLSGVADHCRVTGDNPVTQGLADGGYASVVFEIACPPFWDHIVFSREFPREDADPLSALGHAERTQGDIYVMASDGSNPVNLTHSEINEWGPTWSPDGSQIAFASFRDGSCGIDVMDSDGSNVRRLIRRDCASSPSWSPGGTRIAFHAADWDEGPSDIFVMDADGTDVVNLTDHPDYECCPSWSPDGRRIAFTRGIQALDICVMNADGSNPTALMTDGANTGPNWSPDGRKISFLRWESDNSEVFVMDADGSNPTNLTNDPSHDSGSAWSSDGSHIAFSSDRRPDSRSSDIFVMRADGSEVIRLTGTDESDVVGDWSPGGPQ